MVSPAHFSTAARRAAGAAAMVSVLAIGTPAVAGTGAPPAASSAAPSGKSASAGAGQVSKRSPGVEVDFGALAKAFGLSTEQLRRGLAAAKRAGGAAQAQAAAAAFARATGASSAVSASVVARVFGTAPSKGPRKPGAGIFDAAGVQRFARALGVSDAAAARAASALLALAQQESGGIDPGSAGFRSIAASLGVTPQQLGAAILAVKQAAAQ
jgi:hypothetical protein